jgi:outer membrane murein-binding lipoprotein Lpp
MNSELGMLLPFAFVMFAVWNGTRILLARTHARSAMSPDINARLDNLAAHLDRLEQVVEATATEVHRVKEAEQFTAQLLGGYTVRRSQEPSTSRPTV